MDEFGFEYGAEEHDSPKKGGHTLRRRARVDYTFEQIDDEVVVPSSTSSVRTRKRRSDNSYDSEDVNSQALARRRASAESDTPSSRRRNPARKSSSEVATYTEEADEDENDVQDTIEVVESLSEDGKSTSAATAACAKDVAETALPSTATDETPAGTENSNSSEHKDEPEKSPSAPQVSKADTEADADEHQEPDDQLQQEAGLSASKAEAADPKDVPAKEEDDKQEANNATKAPEDAPTENASESEAPKREPQEPPTKDEPVDDTGALADAEAHSEPKASVAEDEAEQAQDNATMASPTAADEKAPNDTEHPPSPSLQIQQQLDGSTDDAEMDAKPVSAGDDDVADENGDVDEPQDEPMDDEPQADGVEDATASAVASEAEVSVSNQDPDTVMEDVVETKAEIKPPPPPQQALAPPVVVSKPQPTPNGRWAHLTPYMDGEYVTYPEKKEATPEGETPAKDSTPDDKDADKDSNGMEPMVEDNDDAPDASQAEAPTPALNTPTRGSPVPESMEPTAANSPAPVADDAEDDVSDSDDVEERRFFRYRKLRDPEEYISAIENYEDMPTADLYELLEAINVSMVQWQTEWTGLGKSVDDYENSLRRRLADSKYESRTRNLHQHGINYEEPEFVVKGYKAKEKEVMSETRYLQSQDRIMAATYGFEYDPHPSKIGRQNPEMQQVGIMTRGRSLRNQPRQTAKATETDEVTGKRARKPVQLFDPAAQDVSRSSTPVPSRGRRRRNGNGDDDKVSSSFNGGGTSDVEEPPSRTRRRRGGRALTSAPNVGDDDSGASQEVDEENEYYDERARQGRGNWGSGRNAGVPDFYLDRERNDDHQKQPRRHLLTLKIPRGKNFSEPSSAITDNGDSRPSTADSESSSHTAESSYSFRPNRQKRFREEHEENEAAAQGPPKKRGRRTTDNPPTTTSVPTTTSTPAAVRKTPKIKVVRAVQPSRTGTPSSVGGDADEPRKDYKLMTKSEKMSASMKSKIPISHLASHSILTFIFRSMGQR